MRLVFIYGPPGVGKLTVARELAALTGFKLFHNHLTVVCTAVAFLLFFSLPDVVRTAPSHSGDAAVN